MGNCIKRLGISPIENTEDYMYFNICNYVNKYNKNQLFNPSNLLNPSNLSNPSNTSNTSNPYIPFYREFKINKNEYVILTIKIIINCLTNYSTSLWVMKIGDKSFNIYKIKYHSSENDINEIVNEFIDLLIERIIH